MTSTFKLTRAEFKKIFKKPSIYIMAIFLVAVILISLYLFNPIARPNDNIDYGNYNSTEYHNTFFNKNIEDSKYDIDNKFYTTDDIINYYNVYNTRNNNLLGYYNDIINNFEDLKSETSSSALRENKYTKFKNSLTIFKSAYLDFSTMKNLNNEIYPYVQNTINNNWYNTTSLADLNRLIEKTNTEDSNQIVDTFEINEYSEKLKALLDNGTSFIVSTFIGIANDISYYFNNYDNYTTGNSNGVSLAESSRQLLQENIQEYKDYLDLLSNSITPLILVEKTTFEHMNYILEDALTIIDIPSSSRNSNSKQIETKKSLKILNIVGNTSNFAKLIKQVSLDNSTNTYIQSYQKLTNENKVDILNEINSLRTDDSIIDIQKSITNYKLLATSYNELINDTIVLKLSDMYGDNDLVNFANYNLDKFSLYEYNERVTSNKYYIENNIYSNSFMTNFTFNQNSSTTGTNVYDYMYFAMEFCTVIIIIFAMMLICNLITGETESGTIKLLLVRPYRRSKILTAKLFATIFFVMVFMLFSSILTFVGGYFTYGNATMNVLAIFNGSSPMIISPILLMLINIISLTFDVIFFVLLALMISVLFKNYAGSISFCLVIFIVNYVLNVLFGGAFWYSLLPGMNLHLFKYFGNGYTSLASDSILQSILITPIESSMNIIFSFLISTAYSIITIAVAYSVFRKRDF